MRKSNTQPLKDVIREYIDAIGQRRKLNEVKIVSAWRKIMGNVIANHTKNVFIKDGTLFISLDSAALKNELIMQRDNILRHINDYAGSDIIKKVIIK